MKLATRLKQRRNTLKMTQEEVAEKNTCVTANYFKLGKWPELT